MCSSLTLGIEQLRYGTVGVGPSVGLPKTTEPPVLVTVTVSPAESAWPSRPHIPRRTDPLLT
jgi:hypothetical protein